LVGDRPSEAWALNQLGYALVNLNDPEGFSHLERALTMREEFGDAWGEAQTAIAIGLAYLKVRASSDALGYLRRAADLLEPMGAVSLRGVALNNLGEAYFELGDLDEAAGCYQRSRDIGRETGGVAEGHALHNLGRVYARQERFGEAIARFREALPKHRASGDRDGEASTLKSLGEALAETGSRPDARAALAEAARIFEQIGNREQAAETTARLAALPPGPGRRPR
jgi:tetratricopeptide (TPR) repeat protein